MDIDDVQRKISARTRAIMPVHIYGNPVDMQPLLDLAEKSAIKVVEDAAEAHGADYRGRRIGSFGSVSCFSFYANKLVTTGEGGMVVTDDDELAEQARSLRNLCFLPNRRFHHEQLGFNFRLTNLQAALGVAQLERMDEIVARKRAIAAGYLERLDDIDGLQLPVEEEWARSVYWMVGAVLDESLEFDAAEFSARLRGGGIETRPFFSGLHAQPALQRLGVFNGEQYPVADGLARNGLYFPSGLALSDEQLDQVCTAVRKALE
jgi:perosamine synthetase